MFFRRIILSLVALAAIAVGWAAFEAISTWRGIPDAYAAWDAGTLMIAYLESHDDQWPRSWDELLATVETLEKTGKTLRGADGEGGFVYGDLRSRVAIDWSVEPTTIANARRREGELPIHVVTRADGRDFPVVWEGAEPNEMIWRYLRERHAE